MNFEFSSVELSLILEGSYIINLYRILQKLTYTIILVSFIFAHNCQDECIAASSPAIGNKEQSLPFASSFKKQGERDKS